MPPTTHEYHIPRKAEVIFVQDFFVSELLGGAELTSDAIIRACPRPLFQVHSRSITESMVKKNHGKIWVFGNQTQIPPHLLQLFMDLGVRYYFFEYDFKPCVMRSTKKHELQTGGVCNCNTSPHGVWMAQWMAKARVLFWCSEGQRDKFYSLYPGLRGTTTDAVQGSTFYPETILNLGKVRERRLKGDIQVQDRWVVLDSKSWIKGTEDSVAYCTQNGLTPFLLGGVSNDQFIEELARSRGMVFLPRDIDVGSRTTVEAKLLGLDVVINDHVLPKFEPWFNSPTEEIEAYFLDGPSRFWRVVEADVRQPSFKGLV